MEKAGVRQRIPQRASLLGFFEEFPNVFFHSVLWFLPQKPLPHSWVSFGLDFHL